VGIVVYDRMFSAHFGSVSVTLSGVLLCRVGLSIWCQASPHSDACFLHRAGKAFG